MNPDSRSQPNIATAASVSAASKSRLDLNSDPLTGRPREIVYEDLTHDLDQAVREVAGFLDVTMLPGLARCRPRLRRQADHHTERLARLYLRYDLRVIPG